MTQNKIRNIKKMQRRIKTLQKHLIEASRIYLRLIRPTDDEIRIVAEELARFYREDLEYSRLPDWNADLADEILAQRGEKR